MDPRRKALQALLEYAPPALSVNWSDTQESDPQINLNRLAAQLPAFRVSKDVGKRALKAIFYHLHSDLNDRRLKNRLKQLKNKGHAIYLVKNNIFIPWNGSFNTRYVQPRLGTKLTETQIEQLANTILNLPASACLIINRDNLEPLLEGDDSDWENQASFQQVKLDASPLSTRSFNHLLRLHGNEMESLEINHCWNLIDEIDNQITLPRLKELRIPSETDIGLIAAILGKCQSLEELSLGILDETFENLIQQHRPTIAAAFRNLKKLTVPRASAIEIIKKNQLPLPEFIELLLFFSGDERQVIPLIASTKSEIDILKFEYESEDVTHHTKILQELSRKKKIQPREIFIGIRNFQQMPPLQQFFDFRLLNKVVIHSSESLPATFLKNIANGETIKCLSIDFENFMSIIELINLDQILLPDLISLKLTDKQDEPTTKTPIDVGRLKTHTKTARALISLEISLVDIIFSSDIHAPGWKPLFENLSQLIINASTINLTSLIELLLNCPQLKNLELSNHTIESSAADADQLKTLLANSFKLNELDSISIFCSRMNIQCLDALVAIAPRAEFLLNHPPLNEDALLEIEKKHPHILINKPYKTEITDQPNFNNQLPIDAKTHFAKKTYTLSKTFLGKLRSPDIHMIRENVFDRVDLNTRVGADQPFILTHRSSELALRAYSKLKKSQQELFKRYQQSDRHHLYAKPAHNITVTQKWQALPNVKPQDELLAYYVTPDVRVDIMHSERDSQPYIRLREEGQCEISLELLLYSPPPILTESHLPQPIKDMIRNCRGYRALELKMDQIANASAHALVNAIFKQRTGSCRHRGVIFYFYMQQFFPDIPVRIDNNQCHIFVEIKWQNQWLVIDLGGHDASLIINDQHLPYQVEPTQEVSLDSYQLELCPRGKPLPPHFFEKAENLTTLTLQQSDSLPYHIPLTRLDTLEIKASHFTARDLHQLLAGAGQLKTLILADCTMPKGEFEQLNFLALLQLESLQLRGNFIPSHAALALVSQRVQPATTVTAESIHLLDSDASLSDAFAANVTINTQAMADVKIRLPQRYFKSRQDLTQANANATQHVLQIPARSLFIDTNDAETLRFMLQQSATCLGMPSYFIQQADEVRCHARFIQRIGARGAIMEGPGGPLVNFLKAPYPQAVLIVNFNHFAASDIARHNTLIDDKPLADGTIIPLHYKVIGLLNTQAPGAYRAGDFYSRFKHQVKLPVTALPDILNPASISTTTIELCGGDDWESRLVGYWSIDNSVLLFQPGALLKAIAAGHRAITLNNPPSADPEFRRFIHDLALKHGVFYQGQLLAALDAPLALHYTQHLSVPQQTQYLSIGRKEALPHAVLLLNEATLAFFLGSFTATDNKKLQSTPGFIATHAGECVSLYVTMNLSIYTWLKLIEACKEHKVQLTLYFAPEVTLPKELSELRVNHTLQTAKQEHTHVIVTATPEAWLSANANKNAMIIDLDELNPSALFDSLTCQYDVTTQTFVGEEKLGFLAQQLRLGKRLVLTGKPKKEMLAEVQRSLWQRAQTAQSPGTLVVLSASLQDYSLVPAELDTPKALRKETPPLLKVSFDERLPKVLAALEHHPFVILTGLSGVGKTHFMHHDIKPYYRCYYGIGALQTALDDPYSGKKVLFIDEANITEENWSLFNGLCRQPPALFYNNRYHDALNIKVVFAMNPRSYGGGDRTDPALFARPEGISLQFDPLPRSIVDKKIIRPCLIDHPEAENISAPILDVVDYLTACSTEHILITPREIQMMTLLAAQKPIPCAPWARYYAYLLASRFVPVQHRFEFEQRFQAPYPGSAIQLADFFTTKSNQVGIDSLLAQLSLRAAKRQGILKPNLGLGGIILEGEPGIGKSEIIVKALAKAQLVENIDYVYIPRNMSPDEKITTITALFHAGKVIIMEEFSSNPSLEPLFNAILSGTDLAGKPATTPGFLLIGSQNPGYFPGRFAIPTPMQHRLQRIVQPNYTQTEMQTILLKLGLPKAITVGMINEYLQEKMSNTQLCFRDLQNAAKNWLAQYGQKAPLKIAVTDLTPQVGQVCKTVALANVENYFAKTLGFTPLPFKKEGRAPLSIRQLAKENGSIQGEILSMDAWQQNLSSLGYGADIIDHHGDINAFIAAIETALANGHLPLIAMAVNRQTGQPDPFAPEPQKVEHAALITALDYQTDTVVLAHWGKHYTASLTDLFLSNILLVETRDQEAYLKNPNYQKAVRFFHPKYEEVPLRAPGARVTPTQKAQSGFKNKLVIVKKPNLTAFLDYRQSLAKETRKRANANGDTPTKKINAVTERMAL